MLADEDGPYKAMVEPRRGPQAGKSGDPRSQDADNSNHLVTHTTRLAIRLAIRVFFLLLPMTFFVVFIAFAKE